MTARRSLSPASIVWLVITLALIAIGLVQGLGLFPGRPVEGVARTWPAFDAQGHRGARGLYPENTWPAFAAALAIGVTTLEMDVGLSRDGVPVVHHDRRLDPARTRNPDGTWVEPPTPALHDLTVAQLAAYDVGRARPGSRLARRFPDQIPVDGTPVPTLAEVLRRAEAMSGGTIRYNIEIKTAPDAPDETATPEAIADALLAVVTRAGVGARTTIQSFDWRSLKRVQALAPETPTVYLSAERSWLDNLQRGRPGPSPWTAGLDIDDVDGSVARLIRRAGGAVWSPYYRDLRPADIAEAHRLGLRVVVWTVNDAADMAALIDSGVDGIITDYPDRLRRVMAEKGLPLPPAFAPSAPLHE
ncbi:MAG: glycerophosphodiester phosphodiesterase [Alphaproteobacteria bacterium]|nr:MAG: glycerophosphodiester phosphodiesterase [Alphaproteobacteria bacterium]